MEGKLDVGDGHAIQWEVSGNPEGTGWLALLVSSPDHVTNVLIDGDTVTGFWQEVVHHLTPGSMTCVSATQRRGGPPQQRSIAR